MDTLIKKAKEIHGDKYDYSEVNYVDKKTKVIIKCKTHGIFLQTPYHHIYRKQGCKKCSYISISNKNRNTTEDFVKRVKEIHGDKYDYSKINYVNNHSNIIIICKTHGENTVLPSNLLRQGGCKKCGLKNTILKLKSDSSIFIEESKEIHGDKYDYSKVDYVNCDKNVIIICKEHGEFRQTPYTHKKSIIGCLKCAGTYKSNTEEFIQKSKQIHGDNYDYSQVNYLNNHYKIILICKEHDKIEITPAQHLKGYGCFKCKHNLNNCFIKEATEIHGDKYDYSLVDYIQNYNYTKIKIICKKHGEFIQTPRSHLKSNAPCDKCYYEIKTNNFIINAKEIHGDKYDYSNVIYDNCDKKVKIACKKHGEYLQTPYCHLIGSGCALCVNKTEGKILNYLVNYYPTIISQFTTQWCINQKSKTNKFLRFDFCIPEYKIIIELDGRQHFKQVRNWAAPEKQFEIDKHKEKCANENGYVIIRLLQEDVWYDKYDWKKDLLNEIENTQNCNEIKNIYLCYNNEYEKYLK